MSKRPGPSVRGRTDRPAANPSGPSSWQRTLVVVWIAEFIALIGFAMVMPFLPFYVQELGVSDPDQVKFWSGIIVGAQAITMAIFAPIWGSLADRYGRKLMLERATFGAAVLMTLMAFVNSPQQLLALRLLQGCLTGTVPAATALVAGIVPRERTGAALGWLQMGVFAGISVGPLLGGVVADTFDYRTSFLITGACLFVAGLGIFLFVHERFERPEPKPGAQRSHWWDGLATVLRSRDLVVVLGSSMLTRTGVRVIGPVLPLFVAALLPQSDRIATMAGIITGASAAASSVGAVAWGRMGDRIGYRPVLLASAVASSIFYAAQAAVTNTTQLILLQVCVGLAVSGTISALTALLATLAPKTQQGAVFGLSTSAMSGANALGPMLGASAAIALGNRAAFVVAAIVLILAAALTAWFLPARPPATDARPKPVPVAHGCRPKSVKTR